MKGGVKMVVTRLNLDGSYEYIAKLNRDECRGVVALLDSGYNIRDSFDRVIRKSRNNPNIITRFKFRNDKHHWIFRLYKLENDVHIETIH